MKKKNYGFTLVELLAVIVVLGIIMTVAGISVLKIKKNADIETAKKLEQTLADLGPNIYSYEMVKKGEFYNEYNVSDKIINQDFSLISQAERKSTTNQAKSILISLTELKDKNYLKSSDLKVGNNQCYGFLRIYRTSYGPYFEGNVCCPDLYSSNDVVYNEAKCRKWFDDLEENQGTLVELSE